VDGRRLFRIFSESTIFLGRVVGHATPFHTREIARRIAEKHHDVQEGEPDLPVVTQADRDAFTNRIYRGENRPRLGLIQGGLP
jgi:hypothetical protein